MTTPATAEVQGTGNPLAEVSKVSNRTRYTFTLPDKLRERETDPKVVVLQEMSLTDEQRATARAKDGPASAISYELLKASVVEADGRPVTWNNAEKERFVEGLSSKARAALLHAYAKIHVPDDKDVADFLGSMKVQG